MCQIASKLHGKANILYHTPSEVSRGTAKFMKGVLINSRFLTERTEPERRAELMEQCQLHTISKTSQIYSQSFESKSRVPPVTLHKNAILKDILRFRYI